jgi:hypothetical protein
MGSRRTFVVERCAGPIEDHPEEAMSRSGSSKPVQPRARPSSVRLRNSTQCANSRRNGRLAALGSDYKRNRDYLLQALRGCSVQSADCDEDTAAFLVELYAQGHHEVLHALMTAGLRSDGALSEMLGPFLGDVLAKTPSEFVAGLRRVDAPTQKAVCTLAGAGDGGGISPEGLNVARRRLSRIRGDVAVRCLEEIENITREMGTQGQQ